MSKVSESRPASSLERGGLVGEVVIFCDVCPAERQGEFVGATHRERVATARARLADDGWQVTPTGDRCPIHHGPQRARTP